MAMICRIKGYNIKIVLPGNVSIELDQLPRSTARR